MFQNSLKNRGYQDEILEKCISEFDFIGREWSLKHLHGIKLQLIVNVFPSDSHPIIKRKFLFDFAPKFCLAGPLQTHLKNPKAVFLSFHAFKIDKVSHIIWRLSACAQLPLHGFIIVNTD